MPPTDTLDPTQPAPAVIDANDELKKQQAQTQGTENFSKEIPSQEASEAVNLSIKTGTSPDFASASKPPEPVDANEVLARQSSAVHQWAKDDPHKMSTVNGDQKNLVDTENNAKDYSALNNIASSFNAGMSHASAFLTRTLSPLTSAQNPLVGFAEDQISAWFPKAKTYFADINASEPDAMDKAFEKMFKENAPALDTNFVNEMRKGNHGRAVVSLLSHLSEGAPDLMLMGALASAGQPGLAAGIPAAKSAIEGREEAIKEGVPTFEANESSLMKGMASFALNKLALVPLVQSNLSVLKSTMGEQSMRSAAVEMGKRFASNFGMGYAQGESQEIADKFADKVTGVDKNALDKYIPGQAGLESAAGFSVLGAPHLIEPLAKVRAKIEAIRVEDAKQAYLQHGKLLEESSIQKQAPLAHQDIVEAATKDTSMNTVHVSPDAVDTYFQSKGLNPAEEMAKVGLVDEYEKAKANPGTNMSVDNHEWGSKLAGSDHYKGLADDIKYDPEMNSVNEQKQLEESVKAEVEQGKKLDDSAKKVEKETLDKLVKVGMDKDQAKQYAATNAQAFRTLGAKSEGAIDPYEYWKSLGIDITNESVAHQAQVEKYYQLSPEDYRRILDQQRKTEGMQAAVYNPKNGDIQTGIEHYDALKKTPEATRGQYVEGFIKPDGSFINRKQGEKEFGVKMSADLYHQGPSSGEIRFNSGHSISIALLKDADASTFGHELGHMYLKILQDVTTKKGIFGGDKVPQSLAEHFKDIKDWLGVKEGEKITEAQHEKFARGHEAFLMEGKAPTPRLAVAFAKFQEWLTSIYKHIKSLGVPMTPEVRNIYERLYRSDEAINAETKDAGLDKPWPNETAKDIEEAHAKALGELNAKALKDVKRQTKEIGQGAMSNEAMAEKATEAVQDQADQLYRKRLQWLATEKLPTVKKLIKSIVRTVPTNKELSLTADKVIQDAQISDIKPNAFRKQANNHNKIALDAVLKGDFEKAFDEQKIAWVNKALNKKSVEAQKEVSKMLDYAKSFDEKKLADLGKMSELTRNAAEEILGKFNFRPMSQRGVEAKNNKVKQWSDDQLSKGLPTTLPDTVAGDYKKHYSELKFKELREVTDALKFMHTASKMLNSLSKEMKYENLEAAVQACVQELKTNFPEATAQPIPIALHPGPLDKLGSYLKGTIAYERKVESLLMSVAADRPGTLWHVLYKSMMDSQDSKYRDVKADQQALETLLDKHFPTDVDKSRLNRRETFDFLKGSLIKDGVVSRLDMVRMMANHGDEYTRKAQLEGHQLTEDMVNKIASELTHGEWELVKHMWEAPERYWERGKALTLKYTGKIPEKSTAAPFDVVNKAGETIHLEGGHAPVLFDKEHSPTAREKAFEGDVELKDFFDDAIHRTSSTDRGPWMARVNPGGRPLSFNYNDFAKYMDNLAHDVNYRDWVVDAHKIINHPEFKENFRRAKSDDNYNLLNPWLYDVARNNRVESNDTILDFGRRTVVPVALAYKLGPALIHAFNLGAIVDKAGLKYTGQGLKDAYGHFGDGVRNYAKNYQDTSGWIKSNSPMMEKILTDFDRDLAAFSRESALGSEFGQAGSFAQMQTHKVINAGYLFMKGMNQLKNRVEFLSAYNAALDGAIPGIDKDNHKDSVRYAESAVRTITGSGGEVADLSKIQRGGPAIRMFSAFGSIINAQYNQFINIYQRTKMDKDIGRFMQGFILFYGIPALGIGYIHMGGPSDEDKHKQGTVGAWSRWAVKRELSFLPETSVIGRPIMSILEAAFSKARGHLDLSHAVPAPLQPVVSGAEALRTGVLASRGEVSGRGELNAALGAAQYVPSPFEGLPLVTTAEYMEHLDDFLRGRSSGKDAAYYGLLHPAQKLNLYPRKEKADEFAP